MSMTLKPNSQKIRESLAAPSRNANKYPTWHGEQAGRSWLIDWLTMVGMSGVGEVNRGG